MSQQPRIAGLDFEAPILELESKIEELRSFSLSTNVDLTDQIKQLIDRCNETKRAIYSKLTPWQKVQTARHPNRPLTSDYVQLLVDDFMELHGDRAFRDDPAILCGLGTIDSERVMIIGHRKGKDTNEKLACNFGCPHPEGYKKAMRKMRLAEKFGVPIVTLINTPGAYPGVGAEERGQAFVIAQNLMDMALLRVPVVCIVIGEGGSGGALGIGVGDRLLMLEHSYYSVISPEGCAAILWKSAEYKARASETLRLTADDLRGFGIIDEIVPEPLGGAHRDPAEAAARMKDAILRNLADLKRIDPDNRILQRHEKFKAMGVFSEGASDAPSEPASASRLSASNGEKRPEPLS